VILDKDKSLPLLNAVLSLEDMYGHSSTAPCILNLSTS